MTLEDLLDRGLMRRRIMLFAGLAVMLLAVVHRMWPGGPPLGSDWLGLALYLCGATVTVLAAWPRATSADRPGSGTA